MGKSGFEKRESMLYLVLWLVPPALLFLAPDIPFKILGLIAVLSSFVSLYVAIILVPLFRSRKMFSSPEEIAHCIERYIRAKAVLNDGQDIIQDGSYGFRRAYAQVMPEQPGLTKFDEVCFELESLVERYKKEARDIEFMLEKLRTLKDESSVKGKEN